MFLREYIIPNSVQGKCTIEEDIDVLGNKSKHMYMEGLFIQGSVRNANGRVYPTSEIATAVKTIQGQLDSNFSISGECDHPDDLKINVDRISHIITKMWMDGNDGYGRLKIVPTPMGQLIETLLKSGVKLGVSSRGSGNVDETTGVVSDFEIITVDIVASPSAPAAYPKAIYESLQNMKYGNRLLEDLKSMNLQTDPIAQRYLKTELLRFINELTI